MNLTEMSTVNLEDYLTKYLSIHGTITFAEFAQRDKCALLYKLNG